MKELKLLKALLKRRQNITVPILALFIISSRMGYGVNITENVNNEGIIEESATSALDIRAHDLSITNQGTLISDTTTNGTSGINIRSFKVNQIENNGIIKSFSTSSSASGYGIRAFLVPNINEVKNNGYIITQSSSTATGSGSGISIANNNPNKTLINSLINNGILETSGDGIYIENTTVNDSLENNGKIEVQGTKTNGIYFKSATTNNLINTGVVKGTNNGIYIAFSTLNGFDNLGIIRNNYSGTASSGAGTGVFVDQSSETNTPLSNNGTITSFSSNTSDSYGTGSGVYFDDRIYSHGVTNNGVIGGTVNAIEGYSTTVKSSVTNNGILIGETILKDIHTFSNRGITINIDHTSGTITSITNGTGTDKVLNGDINGNDSWLLASNLPAEYNYNLIINGAGVDKGALIIDKNIQLANSIVNGYETAVYINDNFTFTTNSTILNGGGLKNESAVIKGSEGDNTINLLGSSIVNGDIDLGNGDDIATIDNGVQINGNLDGNLGNDILNLGKLSLSKTTPTLNILHDIAGFETINTNGNITLFETVNVTGAENITLESGNLVLRVDPTVTVDGKVTGHALYENEGLLSSTGGTLVLGLNGLGQDAIISMGKTTLDSNLNDDWWKDTDYIKTNSLVLDGKVSTDGKDINITVLESIPLEPSIPTPPVDPEPPIDPPVDPEPPIDPPVDPEPPIDPPVDPPINPEPPIEPPIAVDSFLYEKLNKVYQSIVVAGEIGNLANTTLLEDKTYNESLGGLLAILDQIYANNPYSYTLKSSRDSLKLFEDNLSYLTIKPKKDEMIVQGKVIYTGVKNDNSASGKNYYGFDTDHRDYKTTTNTVGGLATLDYGLSDDTSVGFVFGGNNQDINFKGSSKIKGNSLYLGTFAKTDIKNFKFMSGVGYQYTSADADRKISNRYDSFSTGDKYDINSLNAFVEAKYVYIAEHDWTVEPKVRLSYYYIDQDKVNEGYTPGQISMRTDSVNSNTADVEIGVDFVKSLYLNNGKLKNILSLGVINTIGDKSKELNGYILGKEKDGKKFDIQGAELPKTSGKVSYNLELEQINGMIYTAGVSLEFAKDYNRNVNATVGIGYKF